MRCIWLGATLAVAVAGCGDSSGPTTSVADTPPTPTATVVITSTATTVVDETTTTAPASTTTTVTRPDVDACTLVDAADAASILGSPATVDPAAAGGFGEVSLCAWLTESEALLVVSVFFGRQFYGGSGIPGSEPLDAGDEGSIAVEETFGAVAIQFVKGDWVVDMAVTPFGVADVAGLPATMTEAARRAADRLP